MTTRASIFCPRINCIFKGPPRDRSKPSSQCDSTQVILFRGFGHRNAFPSSRAPTPFGGLRASLNSAPFFGRLSYAIPSRELYTYASLSLDNLPKNDSNNSLRASEPE